MLPKKAELPKEKVNALKKMMNSMPQSDVEFYNAILRINT